MELNYSGCSFWNVRKLRYTRFYDVIFEFLTLYPKSTVFSWGKQIFKYRFDVLVPTKFEKDTLTSDLPFYMLLEFLR